MELTAAVKALGRLNSNGRPVTLKSDSQLLVRGMTDWLPKWKANGWRKAKGKLENVDLWQELDRLSALHCVDWQWIARDSDSFNTRADYLAHKNSDTARLRKLAA